MKRLFHCRDIGQTQLRLAYRTAIDVAEPVQRAALSIFSAIVGQSRSSLLATKVRQTMGAAYIAGSHTQIHSDVASLVLSIAVDARDVDAVLAAAQDCVVRCATLPLSLDAIDIARSYAVGLRATSLDITSNLVRNAVEQALVFRQAVDVDGTMDVLSRITARELGDVAAGIDLTPAIAVVGRAAPTGFAFETI